MRFHRRPAWLLAAALFTAAFVGAHVRLIYSGNGNVLYWSDPANVSIVINETGSDNISDGSHFTALRNAIAAWNEVNMTQAVLKENTSASEQASTNWQSNARHLILFDENNSSGYFPGASGIVAVTPIEFYTSGKIIDSDILFNGKTFLFTTSGVAGRFDVQDVGAHELGHLLGLDHTGCAGATMYPYVDTTVILHRSLSIDDVHGLQAMYPNGSFGTIKGTLTRSVGGSLIKGAWVGARDANGRLAGAALSNGNGRFALKSLSPGTYTVYATPLDYPVSSANLTSGHTVQVDFESTVFGTAVAANGQTTEMGNLVCGPNVDISLGRSADDYPLRAISGQGNSLMVRGANLSAGSTLTASDPSVVISGVTWGGSWVTFTATVPPGAAAGHVDLSATNGGGDSSILCAGLEITPPDPSVVSVVPATGAAADAVPLTIAGTGFNPGLRLVIGDTIYKDGALGGCTVVNSTTITLTTKEMVAGIHDVVVIDATGVEGRELNGYTASAAPAIDSVFPVAGNSAGGTTVIVEGEDFITGSTVTINGVAQPNVTIDSQSRLSVVTEAGVPGGPYVLEVRTPTDDTATAAFSFAAQPDPVLTNVSPGGGSDEGGETVTLTGTDFTAQSEVIFGADDKTGLGGVAAARVSLVDSTELSVVTPASSSQRRTVMVRESDTQQATLLTGAYIFEGSSGGGGGGCGYVAPSAPEGWREVLAGAGWIGVLALWLLLRARTRARTLPARS